MAFIKDGPLSADDIFYSIIFSKTSNLSQMDALYGQRDVQFTRQAEDDAYGTLTGASVSVKPFVIGFITPDVLVNFVPIEQKLKLEAVAAAAAPPASTGPLVADKSGFVNHPPSFYAKLKKVAENIKANPEDLLAILTLESNLDPTSVNYYMRPDGTLDKNTPQAKGLNQITGAALPAAKMSKDFWKNQYDKLSGEEQLDYVQNYFLSCSKGRKFSNIGDLYMANAASGFIGASGDTVVFAGGINVEQNPGLDKNKDGKITAGEILSTASAAKNKPIYKKYLAAYQAAIASGAKPSGEAAAETTGTPSGIMTNGIITDPEDGDPLNNLGRNIQAATGERLKIANAQVEELQNQIIAAKRVPSLVLLVNPAKFTRSYEQTVDPVKVRRGYAVHVWNERPPTISCSGVTAAQYAFRSDGNGGLTHFNRIHSKSYQNLMSLVAIYRNNGHIFRGAPNQDPENAGVPTISMSVFIYYDDRIYIGSFDDFSITDDAEKPHNMSYSFKFTVRYEVDWPNRGFDSEFLSASRIGAT